MSTIPTEDFVDIHNLELTLRSKLVQLQLKEEAFDQSQTQLTECRNFICQLQILVENKSRALNQTRSELKSAMEIISQLENDKIHNQTERSRLEINRKNVEMANINLENQAKKAKLENILLKHQIEVLKANITEQKVLNQVIVETVKDLRNQMNQLHQILRSNIEKLDQEQKYLYNSFQAISELHHRFNEFPSVKCENNLKTTDTIDD